ncbi:hypothetical protein CFC21_072506 [Triticum aestivum]|uniref:Uncharacterized protein n=3 Tax=Triticum TaxID=4564 RepID=A0A9R1G9L1_WHEAT|nr:uncharacterized protein LOC123116538 [Triticum aestivum]KAF7042587.1 hypothetical protein CFC21_052149 [Triticum aestivum]KAF7066535.1 hypothetical protein CFC21_072506 [Triticum aestivum]VAI34428.1 unnamed protein product [Triticum turgidum subsp. durum]
MKIGKAPELVKKAAAMCKSKTGVLAARLLILASLQRRGMATAAVVSHKIDALIMADWERVDRHKALALRTVEKRPVVVHKDDLAANFPRHLGMIDQENGHGGCHADRTLHPLFNDDHNNCRYTCDGDVLLDSCDQDDDDEPSVLDVIRSNREVEGLEFNLEEEIDQAADMFIRRFRQRLNEGF